MKQPVAPMIAASLAVSLADSAADSALAPQSQFSQPTNELIPDMETSEDEASFSHGPIADLLQAVSDDIQTQQSQAGFSANSCDPSSSQLISQVSKIYYII